jgi:hypothetical protein
VGLFVLEGTGSRSGNVQSRSLVSVGMRLYDDLHVLIERDEKAQEPFDGKLPERTPEHLGDIGLADAEKLGGCNLLKTTLPQDGVDFENKLSLNQVLFGIRYADIFERIAAPDLVVLPGHSFASIDPSPRRASDKVPDSERTVHTPTAPWASCFAAANHTHHRLIFSTHQPNQRINPDATLIIGDYNQNRHEFQFEARLTGGR